MKKKRAKGKDEKGERCGRVENRTERIPAASCVVFSFLPFLPSTTQRRKQSTTHKVHVVVVSGRWLREEEVVVVVEEEEKEEEEGVGVFMLLIDRYSR